MKEITNMMDVIDSREIIERMTELEAQFDAWVDLTVETAFTENNGMSAEKEKGMREALTVASWSELCEEGEELAALKALADEAEGYSDDWKYGATLIRESYFQDYAQELAEDCCDMPKNNQWPMYCIDWAWAARELAMDYTQVEFDGVTYLVR